MTAAASLACALRVIAQMPIDNAAIALRALADALDGNAPKRIEWVADRIARGRCRCSSCAVDAGVAYYSEAGGPVWSKS